jgi:hypothetical protein
MTHKECTASTLDNEALAAYRAVANGLRHCLDMADIGAEYGHTWHAAEYVLGALADLEPELVILSKTLDLEILPKGANVTLSYIRALRGKAATSTA